MLLHTDSGQLTSQTLLCTDPIGMLSCTHLKSGVSYLDADFTIRCYDATHWRYVGAAVFWLFAVTLGIPLFFLWLLRHFRVPHMARVLEDNAWIKEAVQLAWQERVPQPDVDVSKLNIDNISDDHLESLYAFCVRGSSAEEAGDILAGRRAPLLQPVAKHNKKPSLTRLQHLMAGISACVEALLGDVKAAASACYARVFESRSRGPVSDPDAPRASERRLFVLAELLNWCRTSGDLSLPALQWEDDENEEAEKEEEDENEDEQAAHKKHAAGPLASGAVRCADIPRLQARAMREVGFLCAAYRYASLAT